MDLNKNVKSVVSIIPQTLAIDANGSSVDALDFNSGKLVISVGALDLTSGNETYNVKVQESDNDSDFTDLTGATIAVTAANSLKIIPLNNLDVKAKRYLRAVLTVGGTTPSILLGVTFELGDSLVLPVA